MVKNRVCNPCNSFNTSRLVDGVEKDKHGAPVFYHIMRGHPGNICNFANRYKWDKVQVFGKKSGRRYALHYYQSRRPGQTRGIPYLACVMDSFHLLNEYRAGELSAAVVAGRVTMFIKTATGELDFTPIDNSTGMAIADTSNDENLKLEAGSIIGLAPGEDIADNKMQRPNTAFDPFVMSILRQAGVGLNLPYEILIKHFTASFSAARQANLEAWKFYLYKRKRQVACFNQPIYEACLVEAIASGRLKAPGFFDNYLIQKAYCGSEWIGNPPGQIDPVKEAKAIIMLINKGVMTTAQATAMYGGDFWQNVTEIKKETEALKDAGISDNKEGSRNNIESQIAAAVENSETMAAMQDYLDEREV